VPSGAAVIRYAGKRGVVFYVKFVDAGGRQVKERLGREADGWTERKARAELEARLTDVRREGLRKPQALTFSVFAGEWLSTYPDAKGLKRSTRAGYESIVERHFKPALGHLRLEALNVGQVEQYLAAKRRAAVADAEPAAQPSQPHHGRGRKAAARSRQSRRPRRPSA
jgi:Phage integrase, N-terminal SAM-like domain